MRILGTSIPVVSCKEVRMNTDIQKIKLMPLMFVSCASRGPVLGGFSEPA